MLFSPQLALRKRGGSNGTGGGGGGGGGDFSSVVLLAGFNGTNGATSFTDESTANNKGAATFNSGAQLSNTQVKFGTTSLKPNGNTITWAHSTDWEFGSGLFTVEAFVWAPSFSSYQFIVGMWDAGGSGTLGWTLYTLNGNLGFNNSQNGVSNNADLTTASPIATSAWKHVACDFDGTKYRLYYDGAMVASSTTLRSFYADGTVRLAIGGSTDGLFIWPGYIDEVRIYKGVAKYASDSGLTVPTAEFPRS